MLTWLPPIANSAHTFPVYPLPYPPCHLLCCRIFMFSIFLFFRFVFVSFYYLSCRLPFRSAGRNAASMLDLVLPPSTPPCTASMHCPSVLPTCHASANCPLQVLAAVPPARLRRMQAALRCAAQHFVYSSITGGFMHETGRQSGYMWFIFCVLKRMDYFRRVIHIMRFHMTTTTSDDFCVVHTCATHSSMLYSGWVPGFSMGI